MHLHYFCCQQGFPGQKGEQGDIGPPGIHGVDGKPGPIGPPVSLVFVYLKDLMQDALSLYNASGFIFDAFLPLLGVKFLQLQRITRETYGPALQ